MTDKGKGNKKAGREGAKEGITVGMGAGLCVHEALCWIRGVWWCAL